MYFIKSIMDGLSLPHPPFVAGDQFCDGFTMASRQLGHPRLPYGDCDFVEYLEFPKWILSWLIGSEVGDRDMALLLEVKLIWALTPPRRSLSLFLMCPLDRLHGSPLVVNG